MTDINPEQNGQNDATPEVKIPVNADTHADIRADIRSEAEMDEVVREYEAKYAGIRRQRLSIDTETDEPDESLKKKHGNDWQTLREVVEHLRPDFRPSSVNATTTEEERMWAAFAHLSALVTLLIGLPTGGLTVLATIFIPLGIYLMFRQRSDYVANQALQSFALQIICTLGVLFVALAVVLAGAVVSLALLITLVGAIAIPFVWLGIVMVLVVLMALPLGMAVLGTVGAWEAYQGRMFRYPYIATWIDQQIHAGFLKNL